MRSKETTTEWWWDRAVWPMRRIWLGVATRLGLRKTGLVGNGAGLRRLRQEVQTCEYEDVRVMWDLLSKSSAPEKKRGRHMWVVVRWATFNFCPRRF